MTIVEAIKRVLENYNEGLTSREIYKEIIDKNLYAFPAKEPVSVVNTLSRAHRQVLCLVFFNIINLEECWAFSESEQATSVGWWQHGNHYRN